MAQATASLYGVKTYAEQLAFKEKTLTDEVFLRLPALVRQALIGGGVDIVERDLLPFPCSGTGGSTPLALLVPFVVVQEDLS